MKMLILFVFTAILSSASWSMTPPDYLSVPNWKSCVNTIKTGTSKSVCLPNDKPASCPVSSWVTLNRYQLLSYCEESQDND